MGLSWVALNVKIQTSAVVFWPVIQGALAVGDDSTAIPSVSWLLLPDRTAVKASSPLHPFLCVCVEPVGDAVLTDGYQGCFPFI